MEVHVSRELEILLVRIATRKGRKADELVEDVLAHYFAAETDASAVEPLWKPDDINAAIAQIEQGFLQAERGDLIDADQAKRDIDALKSAWRSHRISA
jgi:hypothetical protein